MLHTSIDHILSDLPAARRAWFHVVTCYPDGRMRCAVGWPRPDSAWRSFVRACEAEPAVRVEIRRRDCVIRVRAAVTQAPVVAHGAS